MRRLRFRPTPRRSGRPSPSLTDATLTVLRPVAGTDAELEYHLVASGQYQPERPAPMCFDHDSPLFDDCGDAASFELEPGTLTIEEVVDEDGEVVGPDHKYHDKILSADAIRLTRDELSALSESAAENYSEPPEYDDDDSGWEED